MKWNIKNINNLSPYTAFISGMQLMVALTTLILATCSLKYPYSDGWLMPLLQASLSLFFFLDIIKNKTYKIIKYLSILCIAVVIVSSVTSALTYQPDNTLGFSLVPIQVFASMPIYIMALISMITNFSRQSKKPPEIKENENST